MHHNNKQKSEQQDNFSLYMKDTTVEGSKTLTRLFALDYSRE